MSKHEITRFLTMGQVDKVGTRLIVHKSRPADNKSTEEKIDVGALVNAGDGRMKMLSVIHQENLDELKAISSCLNFHYIHEFVNDKAFEKIPEVWVVAGGPSLRKFNFNLLEGHTCIAANRSFEKIPYSTVVSMDARFKRWCDKGDLGEETKEKWNSHLGPRIFTFVKNSPLCVGIEMIYKIDKIPNQSLPSDLSTLSIKKGLPAGNNSGYMSLLIAIALGAKKINLLGFDMGTGDPKKKLQEWHHQSYPAVSEVDYRNMMFFFKKLAPIADSQGIDITLYGDSALDCFKKKPLKDAEEYLKTAQKHPTVINYYTENTSYEEEAKLMAMTSVFHGFPTELTPVPNMGGWTENTYYKCKFLQKRVREELKQKKPKNLVFLDADSRVRRYPELFDYYVNDGADFCYCEFNWKLVPGSSRNDKEVSSAVLFIRPNEKTARLMDLWVDACKEAKENKRNVNEQTILGEVLKKTKLQLDVRKIPMSYCQIFDSMKSIGVPVIEQMQASRRYKKEVGR